MNYFRYFKSKLINLLRLQVTERGSAQNNLLGEETQYETFNLPDTIRNESC